MRGRLQLWLGFLLTSLLVGFGVTAYQLHRTQRLNQIDQELERRVLALASDVRGRPPFGPRPGRPPVEPGREAPPGRWPERGSGPPGIDDLPPELRFKPREIRLTEPTQALFEEGVTGGFFYAVWGREGELLMVTTNRPVPPRPARTDGGLQIHLRMRNGIREAYQFLEVGECVLAGRGIRSDFEGIRRFALWLVAAGGAVLAIGLGGGWWLTGRAIRPVEEISAAASRISAGNLAERIKVANPASELGRLAGVLNSTFARLEAAFTQQKQFTADASHELRTPISVILSEAQATLARSRDAAEYREAVEVCLETAQQMRRLTNSLLELARLDAGQEPLDRRRFELDRLVARTVERIRPLAAERGLGIECELGTVEVWGDPDRIEQVATNLLTNAVDHGGTGGEIRVTTRASDDLAVLMVSDTGPGIAPDDSSHIFERFYRADKARSRASGRSGLGLAICKAIIDAHGGGIDVSSRPGEGTTFTVRLPTRSPSPGPHCR
jgi:two-component system, OmpR family, sensor kinase